MRIDSLERARGVSASIKGPVEADWKREGDTVTVNAKAPAGVELRFERNDSLQGLKVLFNGEAVK